ncbi:MAG: CatB-related O-acetyltransferase [Desulfocapsa sp.]|nr:CatB-related O-acetyltransferase [Desulfocapsa sp.]
MIFSKKNRSNLTRDHFNSPLLAIGEHTYGEPDILTFDTTTRLTIGRFCSISDKVTIILGGNHRQDWATTYPFPALPEEWPEALAISGHPASSGELVIGNDVWICYGATILSGITIGHGAVIGAESVVSKDVAPYSVVAGNPAKEIKKRFDDAMIAKLLQLAWWNWPEDKIRSNLNLLCSSRLEELTELL